MRLSLSTVALRRFFLLAFQVGRLAWVQAVLLRLRRGKGRSLLQPLRKPALRREQLLLQLPFFVQSRYPISLRIDLQPSYKGKLLFNVIFYEKCTNLCTGCTKSKNTVNSSSRRCNFGTDLKLLLFLIRYDGVRKVNG